ncbi:MAG: helix-turn-helix domain-containing protein [Alphaproteobacteria bacterium]|nr:helix-turn-helix domain-containing protein [Alphaproteobacteria bacterium]
MGSLRIHDVIPRLDRRTHTPGARVYGSRGRADWARVDATSEAEIAAQSREDDAEAKADAAACARRVRAKVGLSQAGFAKAVGVPVESVRNWEQGKRSPRGAARALLKALDREPEAVLRALGGVSAFAEGLWGSGRN